MDLRARTSDGVELACSVHVPEAAPGPFPCVVALHGASAGLRAHPLYEHLATTLTSIGVAVAVFDRRGEGASDGVPQASLARLASDARSVVGAVADLPSIDPARIGVWGISQGGWLGPMVAAEDGTVAFVIAVSASGVSPSEQMHFAMENVLSERGFTGKEVVAAHEARSRMEIAIRRGDMVGAIAVVEGARAAPWFEYAYLPDEEDLTKPDVFEIDLDFPAALSGVRVPTLAVYGEWDRWVPIERSIAVWRTAFADRPGSLRIERIARAGHMMSFPDEPDDLEEKGPIAPAYGDALRAAAGSMMLSA